MTLVSGFFFFTSPYESREPKCFGLNINVYWLLILGFNVCTLLKKLRFELR